VPTYNYHRWYAPALGRYLSPEPQSLATPSVTCGGASPSPVVSSGGAEPSYGYARLNPLRYMDPTGRVSVAELELCFLDPFACDRMLDCRAEAFQETKDRFGTISDGDAGNAFLHCYLSCCLVRRVGETRAVMATMAHEFDISNDPCNAAMDIHNNEVGAALSPRPQSCGSLCNLSRDLWNEPPCEPPVDVYCYPWEADWWPDLF